MAAAVTPLPKLATPQDYAAFFNAHVNKGQPVAGGLNLPGASVGDQWLAFYAAKHGQLGSKYTLQAYAAAFLADVTIALTNTDLQAGISTGATTAATAGVAAAQGGIGLYQQGILGELARLSSSAVWLRVVKVVVGGTLLIIALAHMTGADNALAQAARRAPLPI